MEDISNKSAGSLESSDRCLVCCGCATHPKLNSSTSKSNASNTTANIDFERWIKATKKIFEHLLVPEEHLLEVKKQKCLSFCPNCMIIVEEIIQLQRNIEVLELKIERKVEKLGRIAIDTPGDPVSTGIINRDRKEDAAAWKTFKFHVNQNFVQGFLPTLSRAVNDSDVPSSFQKSRKLQSTTNSKTFETESVPKDSCKDDRSTSYSVMENVIEIETDEDENMDEIEAEEDVFVENNDSNEDFVGGGPVSIQKENAEDKDNQNTSEMVENVKIINAHLQEDKTSISWIPTSLAALSSNDSCTIEDNNNLGIKLKNERIIDDDSNFQHLNTTANPDSDDMSEEEIDITIEYKTWVGDTEDAEEMNQTCNESGEGNIGEENIIRIISASSHDIFEQLPESENDMPLSETLRPRRSTRLQTSTSENQSHPTSENNLSSRTVGIDYFSCPVINCTFVALIKRDKSPKQQLLNATEARLKVIEHYRTSTGHFVGSKDSMSATTLGSTATGASFYKCTKCDFKSVIVKCGKDFNQRDKGPSQYVTARKDVIVHFLLEHVLPWDRFPGLFKYGCYEEKSEDGNVLKCIDSDCDYFTKIQCDLEGKNQEECQLLAYQSFTEHALNHNYNSFGFGDNNQISDMPVKAAVSCPKSDVGQCQVIQLNIEEDDNDTAPSFLNSIMNAQFIAQEMNLASSHSQVNVIAEITIDDDDVNLAAPSFSELTKTSKPTQKKSDIGLCMKGARPVGLQTCTDIRELMLDTSDDELFDGINYANQLTLKMQLEISAANSDCDSSSTHTQPKRQKFEESAALANIANFGERTSASVSNIRDPATKQKALEGLREGRDYFKCTKCDYVAKKTTTSNYSTPSYLRRRVFDHYTTRHNPVKPSDKSKTIDGYDCYSCTMCDFSIVFEPEEHSTSYSDPDTFLRKLSAHYMEHDVGAKYIQFNSNPVDKLNTSTSTDGTYYFTCPFGNCKYIACIKRDENPKQQLQNATEARLKIIQHFKNSKFHFKECKSILLPINTSTSQVDTKGVIFYKCTKCDFKSFANEDCRQPKDKAHKDLVAHFLREHVLPWEKFPGFYKYGCYEEESEDGHFLRCPYSKCDFCINIRYDLEGKSEEECQLEAYQSFVDIHAIHHHFNSVDFDDDTQFFSQMSEEALSVESSQLVQLKSEVCLQEYEEVEEIDSS